MNEPRHVLSRDVFIVVLGVVAFVVWVVSLLMLWHATKAWLEVLNYIQDLAGIT